MARTAYAHSDLVVCDDPLSALDAGTGKRVFERLFKSSEEGLFSNSGVLLVTHANHFLHRVDRIVVLFEGRMSFCGTWDELLAYETKDPNTQSLIDTIKSSVQEDGDETNTDTGNGGAGGNAVSKRQSNPLAATILPGIMDGKSVEMADGKPPVGVDGKDKKEGELMTTETREHGFARIKVWLLWFKYAGGFVFLFLQFLFLGIDRFAYVATEVWLSKWTEGADEPIEMFGISFRAQSDGLSAQFMYLAVYAVILVVSFVATVVRSEWAGEFCGAPTPTCTNMVCVSMAIPCIDGDCAVRSVVLILDLLFISSTLTHNTHTHVRRSCFSVVDVVVVVVVVVPY